MSIRSYNKLNIPLLQLTTIFARLLVNKTGLRLLDQLVKPPGGVVRDQSSNTWSGEFLVGGMKKKPRLFCVLKAHVKWTGPLTVSPGNGSLCAGGAWGSGVLLSGVRSPLT